MMQVTGIRIERGQQVLVDGLDFSVPAGSALMLRGPNGSGKSTLLRTIMGLTAATSGLIHVAGRTIPGELGKARDCSGHLPQRSSFPGRYTMREALDYATWTSPSRPPSARSSQSRPRSPQSC